MDADDLLREVERLENAGIQEAERRAWLLAEIDRLSDGEPPDYDKLGKVMGELHEMNLERAAREKAESLRAEKESAKGAERPARRVRMPTRAT